MAGRQPRPCQRELRGLRLILLYDFPGTVPPLIMEFTWLP